MTVECFLDTNILLYAAAGRGPDEGKRQRALDILEGAEFGTSAQVLQEFFVNATRKMKVPLTVLEAAEWIDRLVLRPVAPTDETLIKSAIGLSTRYQVSYRDAAVVAASLSLDAAVLYSEDLNHGQYYDKVRVVNPFLPA
jgi:predicted nucleic acid-binding protein